MKNILIENFKQAISESINKGNNMLDLAKEKYASINVENTEFNEYFKQNFNPNFLVDGIDIAYWSGGKNPTTDYSHHTPQEFIKYCDDENDLINALKTVAMDSFNSNVYIQKQNNKIIGVFSEKEIEWDADINRFFFNKNADDWVDLIFNRVLLAVYVMLYLNPDYTLTSFDYLIDLDQTHSEDIRGTFRYIEYDAYICDFSFAFSK